jgi:hypothetical protein
LAVVPTASPAAAPTASESRNSRRVIIVFLSHFFS